MYSKYLLKGQPKYLSNKLRGGVSEEHWGGAIVLTSDEWKE